VAIWLQLFWGKGTPKLFEGKKCPRFDFRLRSQISLEWIDISRNSVGNKLDRSHIFPAFWGMANFGPPTESCLIPTQPISTLCVLPIS